MDWQLVVIAVISTIGGGIVVFAAQRYLRSRIDWNTSRQKNVTSNLQKEEYPGNEVTEESVGCTFWEYNGTKYVAEVFWKENHFEFEGRATPVHHYHLDDSDGYLHTYFPKRGQQRVTIGRTKESAVSWLEKTFYYYYCPEYMQDLLLNKLKDWVA